MTYKPQEGVDYIVDLYAVAGTERDAAEADIKTALNGRAMEYHPDRLEGLAPEFLEKGERIAKLLNRARGILLDTDKRFEYDGILSSWEGPLSTDGTPIISMSRIQEVKFRDESPEQVEMHFRAYQIAIRSHTGYSPNRLDFLEQMLEQSGDDVSEELRSEYEDALLQKDRALAIEEAERSKLLGMPEIEEQNYAATLNYGEETAVKIDEARANKEAELQRLAIGGVGTRLALLAGEPLEPGTDLSAAKTLELPAYYESQSARVQEIANERESITDKRLSNFEPTYPEAELQTEIRDRLIIGVAKRSGHMWIGITLNTEDGSAEFLETTKAIMSGSQYNQHLVSTG